MHQVFVQSGGAQSHLTPAEVLPQFQDGYRLLFEANPYPMWVYDEETLDFLAVNEAAVRHYGFSREEFLRMNLRDIRPAECVAALIKSVKEQRGLIVARTGVWLHRKKNGTLFEAEITVSSVTLSGKPARLVLANDITNRRSAEQALLESQQRLQFLISSTPAVIYACSPVPPYAATFVSDNLENVLGYPAREFLEDANFWVDHLHPEDAPEMLQSIPTLFERGSLVQRYRFLHQDGVYRWMRDDLRLVRDDKGKPKEILGCWLDITERKEAEEEMKRQAELLDLASDAIFVRTLEDRITFWNLAAERLYGWSADEALGRRTSELLQTEFPEPAERILARLRKTGRWEGELQHTTRTGAKLMMSSRWALQLDKNGNAVGVLEVNTNITERKRAEAALLSAHEELELRVKERTVQLQAANRALVETQERLQQVAENSHDVFWLTNLRMNHIFYVSPGYERLWGRSLKQLYRHPSSWIEAVHPQDRPRVLEVFAKPVSKGRHECEYRILRPDGAVRWVMDHRFPVRDKENRVYRLAGIVREITERKELEHELLSISEREQRRLGADLHDDLGQQLVGIEFLSNALEQHLEGKAASRAGEIARLIRKAIEHTRRLARGLAPVQIESDGLEAALEALAQRSSEVFEVQCRFKCAGPIGIKDLTMATHLYRIAQEAITNSVKHGQAKEISLELSRGGLRVALSISDNGRGLGKETNHTQGMGLRIMQHRASAMGGQVAIGPGAGGGARVVCTVPLGRKQKVRTKPKR